MPTGSETEEPRTNPDWGLVTGGSLPDGGPRYAETPPDPYGSWIMAGHYLPHVPGYEDSAPVAFELHALAVEADLGGRVGGQVQVGGALLHHGLQQLVQGRRHSSSTPFEEMPRGRRQGRPFADVTFFVGRSVAQQMRRGCAPPCLHDSLSPFPASTNDRRSELRPGRGARGDEDNRPLIESTRLVVNSTSL